MAVQFTDMDALRQDATFIARVRAAIVQGSVSVGNEDPRAVPFHSQRAAYVAQIMNASDNSFATLFANACATDSGVINAATANGTTAITSANAAARAALVTDAQITAAVANVFNSFFAH